MRYVLLLHSDPSIVPSLPQEEVQGLLGAFNKLTDDMKAAGVYRDAARLRPAATATTVRVRNGKSLTTDGPFAETKEQLGGFFLIDVANLDEAKSWAAKIPSATFGSIEVRPIWEVDE